MAIDYNVNKYLHGINGFGLIPCQAIYTATITADTEATVTVPAAGTMGGITQNINKMVAVITASNPSVFVAVNATAEVPGGASFAASTSSLVSYGQPYCRYLQYGDTLHFITHETSANVSVEFYTAPF